MKKLLILSASNLKSDPRVFRQILALIGKYSITASGHNSSDIPGLNFIQMEKWPCSFAEKATDAARLLLRSYSSLYWSRSDVRSVLAGVADQNFDIVLANDAAMLPLAAHLAERWSARLVFDAHEYSPKEFEESLKWRIFFQGFYHWVCRTYLSRVDSMMTVCDGIAEAYLDNYGIKAVVVTNAPLFSSLQPTAIDPERLRMIHHGAAIPGRNLELMIEMVRHLDARFSLDLMLIPTDAKYYARLQKLILSDPRIHFVPTVPMSDIARTINKYDVGVVILPPTNFNNVHTLPNKFFEYIQARLAVAIGPSIEMKKIVNAFNLGVVGGSFSPKALAAQINLLSANDIAKFKQNAHAAASSLCAEKSAEIICKTVGGN